MKSFFYENSFRDILRERFFQDIIHSVPERRKVLIVDEHTTRIINSLCRLSELMDHGVAVLQLVSLSREPLPKMAGVYFLSPSSASVEALAEDWSFDKDADKGGKKKKKGGQAPRVRLYKSAYAFFTGPLDDDDLTPLLETQFPVYAKFFGEVPFTDLVCREPQVFHFGEERALAPIFEGDVDGSTRARHQLQLAATRLKGVLEAVVGASSDVEIRASASLPAARRVAEALVEMWDNAPERQGAALFSGGTPTVLVVDRSCDMMAPMMHELSYQAMLYDMFAGEPNSPLQDHVFKMGAADDAQKKKKKDKGVGGGKKGAGEHLLDELDGHWRLLRHLDVSAVPAALNAAIDEVEASNKMAKVRRKESSHVSVSELSQAMKDMPLLKAFDAKQTLHTAIYNALNEEYQSRSLGALIEAEQCVATGKTRDGDDFAKPLTLCRPILQDVAVSPSDKMRLLALCAVAEKRDAALPPLDESADRKKKKKAAKSAALISEGDWESLIEYADLDPADVELLEKYRAARARLRQDPQALAALLTQYAPSTERRVVAFGKKKAEELAYVPVVKTLGERMLTGELDDTEFPVLRKGAGKQKKHKKALDSSAAGGASSSTTKKSGKRIDDEDWKGKSTVDASSAAAARADGATPIDLGKSAPFIIYVVGGVTYGEARCIYELAQTYHQNIAIGGDNMIIPDNVFDQLEKH